MANNITVTQIVFKYLTENGYDGLAGDECGCSTNDICPCDDYGWDCVAGHRVTVETCTIKETCTHKLCDEHGYNIPNGWCIVAGKKGEHNDSLDTP